MFELSVALKYLTPRRRQLSVSIITLISILVITLVVWLIVVFFSVTHGLEKSWIQKLVTLTAPIRITPTEDYYKSYYYQIDGFSSESNYSLKTLEEKLSSSILDPYSPEVDGELPAELQTADLRHDGTLKDIVKQTFQQIQSLPIKGIQATDFEITIGNLRLNVVKNQQEPTSLSQTAYLGSFDSENSNLALALLPLTEMDHRAIAVKEQLVNGKRTFHLPSDRHLGEGMILPKNYKEAGAKVGDRGFLTYYLPTLSAVQEQRLPIYVAGFYDPGIIPSGKLVLVNKNVTSLIRASQDQNETLASNGINVRFDDLDQTEAVKQGLIAAFEKEGLSRYWKIESYREFEFAKDLIQQLHSERNLWTLIATVIIIVACSNIISMLIILVNDKKQEIGILRSMGATSASIAFIFGFCGVMMGMIGSILGTALAALTLRNLQTLLDWIGNMQGHQMFNPVFYGNSLPNQISSDALLFVVVATALISLLAGIVPAVKASLLRPSSILRSE